MEKVATSQGILAATRSEKEMRNEFSLRVPKGSMALLIHQFQTSDIDFGPLASRIIGE